MQKESWTAKDGWHRILGYCVLVKNDLVVQYYKEDDPDMTMIYPDKDGLTSGALRARLYRRRTQAKKGLHETYSQRG